METIIKGNKAHIELAQQGLSCQESMITLPRGEQIELEHN